jgi:hypothetical protein
MCVRHMRRVILSCLAGLPREATWEPGATHPRPVGENRAIHPRPSASQPKKTQKLKPTSVTSVFC